MRCAILSAAAILVVPGVALAAPVTLEARTALTQFGAAEEDVLVVESDEIDAGAPAVATSSQANANTSVQARATPGELSASYETRDTGINRPNAQARSEGATVLFEANDAFRSLTSPGADSVDLLFNYDVLFESFVSPSFGVFAQSFSSIDVNLVAATGSTEISNTGSIRGLSGPADPPSFEGTGFLAGIGVLGPDGASLEGATTASILAPVSLTNPVVSLVYLADISGLALGDDITSGASVSVSLPGLPELVTTADGRSLASLGVNFTVQPRLEAGPVEPPPAPIPLPAGLPGLVMGLAALGLVARRRQDRPAGG